MSVETFISGDVHVAVNQAPIKTHGAEAVEPDLLNKQAEAVVAQLVSVDVHNVRGTCIDERGRKGLRSGAVTAPRPSVLGGPDIQALATAELTGFFADDDETSGTERLHKVKRIINAAGIRSGGHDGCAANASFPTWLKTIADSPEAVLPYAQAQLGGKYDESLAQEVVGYARATVASGRYATWAEANLSEVFGEEKDDGIEVLVDAPHEGVTVVRNKIGGNTVDQTPLYEASVLGKGSFVFDDWYADSIENALASGPDATRRKLLAEHARELAIAAVAGAVPNEELYQITLTSATE